VPGMMKDLSKVTVRIIILIMKIDFNVRGNGACPLCKKQQKCQLMKKVNTALEKLEVDNRDSLELVIYRCPLFEENF
jgi:hypothetical protein